MAAFWMRSEVMGEEWRWWRWEATPHVRRHGEHVWRLQIRGTCHKLLLGILIPGGERRPDAVDASSCAEEAAGMVRRAFLGEAARVQA